MKPVCKPFVAFLVLAAAFGFMSFISRPHPAPEKPAKATETRKIQAAILLDVSNSMDGLIEQAKAQLWNMVSVMGKAKCDNDVAPRVEIALYEYGRSTNDMATGYVKQISPFTTDLDKLSNDLFGLSTNGGDEYCGQVIYTSLQDLKWDTGPNNYKVIFIAGNEDFLQGKLPYTKACAEAKNKGVVVNTIYCGSKADGIREHWNLNAECGTGSFTNINSDAKIEEIPTPYDSILYTLNDKLNNTYIAYGYAGAGKKALQAEMDQKNYAANKTAAVKRVAVKSQGALYRNDSWDLVDRAANASPEEAKSFFKNLDKNTLPDSLRNKSSEEITKVVAAKQQERGNIQKEIEAVNTQREAYIAEQKKKNAVRNADATLETEVEKIIREQAKRYNMKIN
ncbi:MAG: vWA domain-containing protein [Ferruginibacter sp.]